MFGETLDVGNPYPNWPQNTAAVFNYPKQTHIRWGIWLGASSFPSSPRLGPSVRGELA
jgi:hypothetical protein